MNALHTASFLLPANDPKNKECQPFRFVYIPEADDLFRILPQEKKRSGGEKTITYELEHVMGTLLDDVIFQYHQIGNLGVYTRDVLEWLISQQTVKRWKLGKVEFNHQFFYKWENENILSSLYSVPKPFLDEYMWTWDTTSYPWTLNLVKPSEIVSAEARYRKNLIGVTKKEDPTGIITRLYPLGYGEGVNQLNIKKVNGGKPYLQAEKQYTDKYGIISDVWADRRYENVQSLYDAAKAMLEIAKKPKVSYELEAADLYKITGASIDKFTEGALIHIYDDEMGIDENIRVTKITKPDIKGEPGNIQLELANKTKDAADTITDLRERQRVNDVYAQGASNIDSREFADNADSDHPAEITFNLPDEMVHLNKAYLDFKVSAFRGYSRATKGGGATTVTSSSGGATTVTSAAGGESTQTSSSGGGVYKSTESGGASTQTSSSGGGVYKSTESGGSSTQTSSTKVFSTWVVDSTPPVNPGDSLPNHYHKITMDGNWFTHSHTVNIPAHSHNFSVPDHSHTVKIPSHTHNFSVPDHSHTVKIPSHTHDVTIPNHTHKVTIPDHIHDILYGIYEGPTPNNVDVYVDGNHVGKFGGEQNGIDLIPFLDKDDSGNVIRGRHELKIKPDDLGRITASVVTQFFIQSRGGGNY